MKPLLRFSALLALAISSGSCEEFSEYAGNCQDTGVTYGYNLSSNLEAFSTVKDYEYSLKHIELKTNTLENICLKYPVSAELRIQFSDQLILSGLHVTAEAEGRTKEYTHNLHNWTNQGANQYLLYNGDLIIDLASLWSPESPPKYGSVHLTFDIRWPSDRPLEPIEEFTSFGGSVWMYLSYGQKQGE